MTQIEGCSLLAKQQLQTAEPEYFITTPEAFIAQVV